MNISSTGWSIRWPVFLILGGNSFSSHMTNFPPLLHSLWDCCQQVFPLNRFNQISDHPLLHEWCGHFPIGKSCLNNQRDVRKLSLKLSNRLQTIHFWHSDVSHYHIYHKRILPTFHFLDRQNQIVGHSAVLIARTSSEKSVGLERTAYAPAWRAWSRNASVTLLEFKMKGREWRSGWSATFFSNLSPVITGICLSEITRSIPWPSCKRTNAAAPCSASSQA